MNIEGHCQPRFQKVQEEFARNFRDRGEVGASVCVMVDGETVVDLWGGVADRHSQTPWERDTLCLVWSCTKGAVALAAHLLVARGQLDLDAPLTRYWPEFGQAGKEAVTVRCLLEHRAGVPVLRRPLRPGGLYDWTYFTEQLAAETPFWTPGTQQGYHASTFGHLVGELIRRITGQDVGTFFRQEVAEPLGLDFHIGLPPEHEGRVAPTIRADPTPPGETPWLFLTRASAEPDSVQALLIKNTGRHPSLRDHDSRQAHAAVLPSQGGISNARGLAGMYAPLALGGSHRGVRLLEEADVRRTAEERSASRPDVVLLVNLRFALGFMKGSDNRDGPPGARDSLVLPESAFGHAGMGGSLGFADPAARLSFGYVMNKQGRGVLLNDRGLGLVDATYRALESSG
jgi:CubicO group peptidase (beta-lactamase class C family)